MITQLTPGLRRARRNLYRVNSIDPFIPEVWAMESVLLLEEKMVMGNLVHRDFSPLVAQAGDVVNTRKPATFVAKRKGVNDNVTIQDATATNIQVPLNQHIHVSFIIKDGEQTKSFKDLVKEYMLPAMQANARVLDRCLAAQVIAFQANRCGGFGMDKTLVQQYLVKTKQKLDDNKAYDDGRSLVITSNTESQFLMTDLFVKANESGDGGNALTNASLGRKFNFGIYRDLNVPQATAATKGTATTTTAAAVAGAASVAVTTAVPKGAYATIAGDMTPLRATTNTTTFTPTRALLSGVASGAVVQPYATGAVNLAAGYAAGYDGYITVDGTGVPHVGQLVSFNDGAVGTGALRTPEYIIVDCTSTTIMLDRPLETALADDDAVCYGPNGDFNFAFHRNALALVNRPLALPMPGTGARAAVIEHNGLSMRVCITYDGNKQGHLVTLDSLFGFAVLDSDLGAVMLA